jgi:hypothetical protein
MHPEEIVKCLDAIAEFVRNVNGEKFVTLWRDSARVLVRTGKVDERYASGQMAIHMAGKYFEHHNDFVHLVMHADSKSILVIAGMLESVHHDGFVDDGEQKAIDAMERGISQLETDYTGEIRRGH